MLTSLAKWFLRGTGLLVLTREEYSTALLDVRTQNGRKNGYRPLTKEVAMKIRRGDFIPQGEFAKAESLKFFPTGEHEVHFCSERTSHDPQSGPSYCGDIAAVIAFTDKGEVLGLCERHQHRHGSSLKAA